MVAKTKKRRIETYDVGIDESGDDELVAGQADELNRNISWWQKKNDSKIQEQANMLLDDIRDDH